MDAKKELHDRVFAAARDGGLSSVLFRNAVGRKVGVNTTDYECLSFLAIRGAATPTELARYTGLSSGATTAMLDRLEKARFITREPNPSDRRGVLVKLTEKWQEAAGPFVAGVQKAHHELIAGYSAEQLEIIADFLTRFTENVKEATRVLEHSR